jgi:hypothetical protein
MNLTLFVVLLLFTAAAGYSSPIEKRASILGIDISSAQPNVNWQQVQNNSISFVFIKATEASDTATGLGKPIYYSSLLARCRIYC